MPLVLRLPGVRLEVLETVVLLGDAQSAETHSEGGGDDPPGHRQYRDLLSTPDHERDERRTQRPDSDDQEHGLWVPQQRAL